jgi:hypothetical protein
VTAAPSPARGLGDLLAGVRFPPGLPPLAVPLHLALVILDDPDFGVGITLGPGWTVTTSALSPAVVHDAVLAAPVELVRAILTGVADPGLATVHGNLTGNLAGQSALAFLVEATSNAAGDGWSA